MGIMSWLAGDDPARLDERDKIEAALAQAEWEASVPLSGQGHLDPFGLGVATTRAQAMAIPAVKRCRGLICGTVSVFPLRLLWRSGMPVQDPFPWTLQPDPTQPRSVTVAWTVDDLLFYGWAYWRVVTTYEESGRPRGFERIDPLRVSWRYARDGRTVTGVTVDGIEAPRTGVGSVILIPGPDEGVLRTGATILTEAAEIIQASYRNASDRMPTMALKHSGADLPKEVREQIMATWKKARQEGSVGWLSKDMTAQEFYSSAKDRQLVEARQGLASEIARLMGVDPFLIGADQGAGSSMSYQNVRDSRRQLIDSTLRPYLQVLAERLSMDDVLSREMVVQFDTDQFTRDEPLARAQFYEKALVAGWMSVDEVRDVENLPPADTDPDPEEGQT